MSGLTGERPCWTATAQERIDYIADQFRFMLWAEVRNDPDTFDQARKEIRRMGYGISRVAREIGGAR